MYSLWQLQNSGQQGKEPNLKVSGQYGSTTGCYFGVSIASTSGLNVTPGNPGKNIFTIRQPATQLICTSPTISTPATFKSHLSPTCLVAQERQLQSTRFKLPAAATAKGSTNSSNSSQGATSNHSRSRHPFRIPSRAATPKEPQTKTAGRAARATAKATAEAIH